MNTPPQQPTQTPPPVQPVTPPPPPPPAEPPAQSPPSVQPPPTMPSAAPTGGGNRNRFIAIGIAAAVVVAAIGGVWGARGQLAKKTTTTTTTTTKQAAPHVKVGFMMAETGGAASMGLGAIKGVQLAQKQLGADNIDIIQGDSKCDKTVAPDVYKKLVSQGVIAVIGEGCSSASLAVLPEANQLKVPMISPSASSPALSIPNDYFFRTVPSDNFQGKYLAEYAYKKGLRSIGQFYTAEPAGQAFTSVFKETFEKLGGKIVASASVESGNIDSGAQAKQLAAAKPEAITVFTNTVTSAVAVINLLAQQGYHGDYFGSDALYDKTVISQTGQAADGHLIVSNFSLGTKAFKQAMANTYQSAELAYAAPQAYDAFHAIQIAVQKGATTGEQLKNALPGIEFDGVGGYHIKFDANGEMSDAASVKYSLLQATGGDFQEINY